jgi:hypothetical protein
MVGRQPIRHLRDALHIVGNTHIVRIVAHLVRVKMATS